jgi:hypothetical protein
VFRFPDISDPKALLRVHHLLIGKCAARLCAEGEPQGQEMRRFVRVVENYGPRHERIGYMYPTKDGEFYKLTWKGAFLMTWRGMWPTALLRQMKQRHAMESELESLQDHAVVVLQKA